MAIDLKVVRQQLEAELQQRVSRAENIDNRLRQVGDQDWEEQATQRENDEVLESLDKQVALEIEQIKQALRRIDNGQYATCIHCGRAIGEERLEALPYTTSCIKCA